MKKINILLVQLALLSFSMSLSAQSTPVEMADVLRSDGKIYAVVAGLVVILIGVIFFLLRIERKLVKIEKELLVKKNRYVRLH